MAKEANVPFLFVSASAFQSMYYGQTNRKIRSFFKRLRKYARRPKVAQSASSKRSMPLADHVGGGRAVHRGRTGVVNELLVQFQSFDTPSRGQR